MDKSAFLQIRMLISGACLLFLILFVGVFLSFSSQPSQPTQFSPSYAAPQQEDVLVYTDNMQNGTFDAMSPSGSGIYSVMDDGGSNMAAKLTGSTLLEMRPVAWSAFTWENYDILLRVKQSGTGTAAFGFRWILPLPSAPSDSDRGYWLENSGNQWSLLRQSAGVTTTLQTVTYAGAVGEWYQLTLSVNTTPAGAQVEALINGTPVLSYLDATPIPFGGLAFRTNGTAVELWLDDVEVVAHVDSRYTWSQTGGPEGADWLNAIVVDPRDWRVAYMGGGDAGLFKTTDGGTTWTEIGLANGLYTPRIKTIELAPTNPDIIYAGTGGKHVGTLWRSDNGGENWVWTATADIDTEAETGGVAVDPGDPMHIYFSLSVAAVGPGGIPGVDYGIYESNDGGITVTHLTSLGEPIGPVEIDPGDPGHLLAGSIDAATSGISIISSIDGGNNWTQSDSGINGKDIRQILFYPPDPATVFAVTLDGELNGKIYRSTDGGVTWTALPALTSANFLQYSPQTTPMLLASGLNGLYASTDMGGNWTAIAAPACEGDGPFAVGTDDPDVIYTSNAPDLLVSTDMGQSCTNAITDLLALPMAGLGVAPSDPDVVYAGNTSSLHRTTDGGETWEFLRVGQFAGIAVDPVDSDTVYIGAAEFAQILKSTDGGQTWADVTGPISFPGVHALTIDPQDRLTIYAGTGHGPQMGGGGEGLYKSTDGGQSWSKVTQIPDVAVPVIVIHPADSNVVVVGTSGYGVYMSIDGGTSFVQRNNGFLTGSTSPMVWALAIHPTNPDVMYAGTNAFYGRASNAAADALYKTTDGGLNWTLLLADGEITTGGNYPFLYFGCCVDAIAIHPQRPDEVYVGLHDPGILFTENGGQDWRYVNYGLVPVLTHLYPYRMTISSGGEVLYTTTCGRSIFKNRLSSAEGSQNIYLPIVLK